MPGTEPCLRLRGGTFHVQFAALRLPNLGLFNSVRGPFCFSYAGKKTADVCDVISSVTPRTAARQTVVLTQSGGGDELHITCVTWGDSWQLSPGA